MKLFKKFPYLLLLIVIIVGAIYFYSRPTHEGFESFLFTRIAWYWWILIIFVFLFFLYMTYVSTMSKAYALRTGINKFGSGAQNALSGWASERRAKAEVLRAEQAERAQLAAEQRAERAEKRAAAAQQSAAAAQRSAAASDDENNGARQGGSRKGRK